ncbi:MAG TPA: response regulator transcription factor [Solirubrobacteraceae bacterium]|jgi:DNA-binding response OmpR family regulator
MSPNPAKRGVAPAGSPSILLAECHSEIAAPLAEQLTADGYPTALAHTAQHARALAALSPPALLILGRLDSGLALLSEVRHDDAHWPHGLPVIVLGSPTHQLDLLRAFAAGADDFLAHPAESDRGGGGGMDLHYLELRARLQALLRRAAAAALGPHPPCLSIGPLHIDTSSRAVLLHEHPVRLRPREYALLLHLARQPTHVFAKPDLLRALWGFHCTSHTRTLDSHACRLRCKLAPHAHEPWVLSVWGVGYRLTE